MYRMKKLLIIFLLLLVHKGFSQENYLGEGPFDQLIIRGVTLINGDGSPPRGPVDIVVENNIIVAIQVVGYPGVEIEEKNRPKLKNGGKELDASGMYLLPGFIDMHGHIGGKSQGANASNSLPFFFNLGLFFSSISTPGYPTTCIATMMLFSTTMSTGPLG